MERAKEMAEGKQKKTKVFLTEDLKHKVAAEFGKAKRRDKAKVAARYSVSPSSVRNWLRAGYGTGPDAEGTEEVAVKPRPSRVESPAAELGDILVKAIRGGLKAGTITEKEALRLLMITLPEEE